MAAKKSTFNPKLLIVGVIVLILVGVGAFMMMGNKGTNTTSSSGSNAFTSIKDALSKSLSLQCEFTDSDGRSSKVYIKNGAVRGDFSGATVEESGSMIMRDKKMYVWNGAQGFMMELPDENMDYDGDGTTQNQGESFMKEIEQYKESCKPAVVSDSLFTVPSDVTFSDMSKMMDGMMEGAEEGTGMSEEELKKMMEQYQTEQ